MKNNNWSWLVLLATVAACSEPAGGDLTSSTGGTSANGGSGAAGGSGGAGGASSGGVAGNSTSGSSGSSGGGTVIVEPISFEVGTMSLFVPDKGKSYDTSTLGPVTGSAALSKYGGDLSRKVEGTGYFRTTRDVNGDWYFVDPDGYLFISVALNSVSPGGGIELPGAIQDMGFNSLGNWSDYESVNQGTNKLPYTTKYSFASSFVGDASYDGGTGYLSGLLAAGVIPVVFDNFDQFCDKFAQQIAALADDPWVIGIFSDNELPFYDGGGAGDVLDRWMALPTNDAYYGYAVTWLKDRGKLPSNYTSTDKDAFAGHIVDVYYAKVSAALKRYDSHHLYIGTRFHGAAKSQASVMAAAGPYVDVVSVNYYGEWMPSQEKVDMWLEQTNKPFILTEFYVKGSDSGLGNVDGAGWTVATQTDRGLFYTSWLLNTYSHPGAIGTHWFRYIDKDGQDSNKGFLSEQYEWYKPLCDEATNTNRQIYQLVEYLRK